MTEDDGKGSDGKNGLMIFYGRLGWDRGVWVVVVW